MESEHAVHIYRRLHSLYGIQGCCLEHETPFQLLVATILSAQCTDRRVNLVTRDLFARYPDAESMVRCSREELERLIFPCGFYHAKAGYILETAKLVLEQFEGKLPCTMEELIRLPGVGRKTANVVLGDAFHLPGFPVDTHVKRLSNLTGLSKSCDPEQIEKDLCRMIPSDLWSQFSHLLIIHGRTCCRANRPNCIECGIRNLCNHGICGERKAKKRTASIG